MKNNTLSRQRAISTSIIGKLWALFALLLIFSLWPDFRPDIGSFSVHPSIFLIPVILIAALPFYKISFRNIGIHLFFALLFLNIILTSFLFNGVFNLRPLIKWTVSFLILVLSASTLKKREDFLLVLKIMVISIGIMCFYGLIKWTGRGNPVNPFIFASRNALSNWTPGVFPICLILCLFYPASLRERILWGVTFIIMILAQSFTLNRSGWIIIILSIISVFLVFRSRKLLLYLLLLFVSFYIACSYWFGFEEIEKRFNTLSAKRVLTDLSFVDRIDQARKAFTAFSEKPLLGIGIGQFRNYDPGFEMAYKHEETHSIYLTLISETGILGILSLGLFTFFTIFSLLKAYHRSENVRDRYIMIMLGLATLMCLIRGLTSHEIQFIPTSSLVFGFSIGYSAIINSSKNRKSYYRNKDLI